MKTVPSLALGRAERTNWGTVKAPFCVSSTHVNKAEPVAPPDAVPPIKTWLAADPPDQVMDKGWVRSTSTTAALFVHTSGVLAFIEAVNA
ncbi:MAG: hypothetical protein ABI822_00445, partial [Bryobacteraceae bacterium]